MNNYFKILQALKNYTPPYPNETPLFDTGSIYYNILSDESRDLNFNNLQKMFLTSDNMLDNDYILNVPTNYTIPVLILHLIGLYQFIKQYTAVQQKVNPSDIVKLHIELLNKHTSQAKYKHYMDNANLLFGKNTSIPTSLNKYLEEPDTDYLNTIVKTATDQDLFKLPSMPSTFSFPVCTIS